MFDAHTLNRLYRYAWVLARDESAAYDLVQDALERYLRLAGDPVDSPFAYVRGIIRNRFLDTLRENARHPTEALVEPTGVDIDTHTLETLVIEQEELELIWGMLEPLERELLYFWAVEGCTAREIAQRMGAPRGTVLSWIHRLRGRIRSRLDGAAHARGGAP